MLIGLTGSIACGKTTVAQQLQRLGAFIIDADQVAREVVAPGTQGLLKICDVFGGGLLSATGHLDRAALGELVFADPAARQTLQRILHPLIAAESQRQIAAAMAQPLVVYDAALLFEIGRAEDFRPVVVVYVSPQIQLQRLMARDGISAAVAQQRIDSQMPIDKKAALADHVIDNSEDRSATEAQVHALWRTLVQVQK